MEIPIIYEKGKDKKINFLWPKATLNLQLTKRLFGHFQNLSVHHHSVSTKHNRDKFRVLNYRLISN